MTVIIGVLCSDGVVLGADGAATFTAGNQRTIQQPTSKLHLIDTVAILGGTGSVGLGQRFAQVAHRALAQERSKATHIDVGKAICAQAIADAQQTGLQQIDYGSLLAFEHRGEIHLCEFAYANLQPEFKAASLWYASIGSGQTIVDPFLGLLRNLFWADGLPTRRDASFAITWALRHAINVCPGGLGDPISLAELLLDGTGAPVARMFSDDELREHEANVVGLEDHIRAYPRIVTEGEQGAPDVPEPDDISQGEEGTPPATAAPQFGAP